MNPRELLSPWQPPIPPALILSVHLAQLRLRDFRNYERLDIAFQPGFHLLLGANAQGKTNLLEAIYLLATLRSFRGVGAAQMIRHGRDGCFAGAKVVGQAENDIKLYSSGRERRLTLNQRPIRRLADYWGVLRCVVFCSEDAQLVKGPASGRRRFLDLLLAQSQPGYISLLQRYARALRARNALLKRPSPDPLAMDSFTKELISAGEQIISLRSTLMPKVSPLARLAYRRISDDQEELKLSYRSSVKGDFAVELAQSRRREETLRSTIVGPHRDELMMTLNDQHAAQYGSEGQKRTLAMALKTAQAEFLAGVHGTPPILLIDDVMGELDLRRRSGFIPLLEKARRWKGQVFMTATEMNWPEELSDNLTTWTVAGGTVELRGSL